MIGLEQYRKAVGIFHAGGGNLGSNHHLNRRAAKHIKHLSSIFFHWLYCTLYTDHSHEQSFYVAHQCAQVIATLLIIGNVEKNPGPITNHEAGNALKLKKWEWGDLRIPDSYDAKILN